MKKEDPQLNTEKKMAYLSLASEQKALYDLLIVSIKQGDHELFNSCLADNPNMASYKGSDGQSPIHVACEF